MLRDSGNNDESLHSYSMRRLNTSHLKALNDIFSREIQERELSVYINSNRWSDKDRWSKKLIIEHKDNLERFLHILDTDFSQSEISANDVVDYLVNHYSSSHPSVTVDLLEEGSRPDLLLATYFCMYDPETATLSEDFQNLLVSAKIYKQNRKSTFVIEAEQVPFDDLEKNLKEFLQENNTRGERKLAIQRDIDLEEETARMKLYREKHRTARYVFEFRQEGHSKPSNPSDPTVEYESEFAVDTLGMSVRNRMDSVKIEYSGGRDGWSNINNDFLKHVLDIEGGEDALVPKPYPGANHVLDSALRKADELDRDEEEQLIKHVNHAADSLWEEIVAELETDEDISDDQVESAREWYSSLALSGYNVREDEQTNIRQANVRSQGILEDVEEQMSRLGIVEYLQQADSDKIGLYFQIENPESGERAVFEVHQDEWSVVGRGIESEAFQRIEEMMGVEI